MSHDAEMIAHAAARGRVFVVPHAYPHMAFVGVLEAWRPHRTRKGADGTPRGRRISEAVIDGRQYRLNHYTIEAIK